MQRCDFMHTEARPERREKKVVVTGECERLECRTAPTPEPGPGRRGARARSGDEQLMHPVIGGYIPTSFLDYPGNVASVLFFTGCQFRCPFCHNPSLVIPGASERLEANAVLADLRKRAPFLDGVCMTGGEPTLQDGLLPFLKEIRSLGLKIKLDTNGARPKKLEELLSHGVLDYVALDVKAPAASYARACGREIDIALVEKSIALLLRSSIAFEFRTTLVPGIHTTEDAREMGLMTEGAPLFVLQNFRPGDTLDPAYSLLAPFPDEFLNRFRAELLSFAKEVAVRR